MWCSAIKKKITFFEETINQVSLVTQTRSRPAACRQHYSTAHCTAAVLDVVIFRSKGLFTRRAIWKVAFSTGKGCICLWGGASDTFTSDIVRLQECAAPWCSHRYHSLVTRLKGAIRKTLTPVEFILKTDRLLSLIAAVNTFCTRFLHIESLVL